MKARDAHDLAEHLLDHYGQCSIAPCACIRPDQPWLGRGCLNWTPSGASTREELVARARRIHEERRT